MKKPKMPRALDLSNLVERFLPVYKMGFKQKTWLGHSSGLPLSVEDCGLSNFQPHRWYYRMPLSFRYLLCLAQKVAQKNVKLNYALKRKLIVEWF